MIRGVVRAEMVFHRCIGMVHGHFPVNGVSGKLGSVEQHFQVHHIVDDDRIFPFVAVVVPGPDTFHFRTIAGNQCFGTL